MWSSFNLISHPDRTLAEHLASCNEISEKLLEYKFVSGSFLPKEELQQMRQLLVYFHDFGKGTDFFQYKIIEATEREKIEPFISKNKEYIQLYKKQKALSIGELLRVNDRLGNHAKLGAYFLFSNFSHQNPIIECVLLKVIRRHHGELTNFALNRNEDYQLFLNQDSLEELETQLGNLNFELYQKIIAPYGYNVVDTQWPAIREMFNSLRKISKIERKLSEEQTYLYFFLQHYLFSLLLSADKGDMMLEKEQDKSLWIKPKRLIPQPIIDIYKKLIFKEIIEKPIDRQRENAYQDIALNSLKFGEHHFFSITLPTGMGKTFSAFNAAVILQHVYFKQTGCVPRIVYCLPFTSIIDQNSQILSDIFSSNGEVNTSWIAKNHYLSTFNDRYDEKELKDDEGEYLTDGWEQEVIVTTFVQLLEGIFTNRNRALRKFHNMTNAVIILDEVQNIPAKYYEAIEGVFKHMALYFNTKFVFVTATQPFLFANLSDVIELTDPEKNKTRFYFESLNRISLDQTLLKAHDYQPMDLEELITFFQDDISTNLEKSFLIICNTIAHSQTVYNELLVLNPDACFIYLSGSILPILRKELIVQIKENTKNKKRQIIVSTQVVEAGVDIDLDIVYRDFAPLDSINQSAGRCNRNGINGKGAVKLFHSGKASRIYDDILLDITRKVLSKYPQDIEEKELFNLNLVYADAVRNRITDANDSSARLIKAIQELQLETVAENFKLIEEDNYAYNVYIPYNQQAKELWQQYIQCFKIEDFFDRKRAIKKLKPRLLGYVTRFPKNNYQPASDDKNKFIIYEENWQQHYDLHSGFKIKDTGNNLFII